MIRPNLTRFLALAGISALADPCWATQPPCATSDSAQNTACGTGAMLFENNPNVGGNTAVGFGALYSNANGSGNSALGSGALNFNTNGSSNTASGSNALGLNTTGSANTAVGTSALFANATGAGNSALGSGALSANTTGNNNTAVGQGAIGNDGYYTGRFNTGSNLVALGFQALFNNTAGSGNIAVGAMALYGNTTGNDNTAGGYYSLANNTTGTYNAAFGAGALQHATAASDNTALGTGALRFDTTGLGNTAAGFTALYNATTGSGNTAVGNAAGANLVTGSYNTYIGYAVSGAGPENYVTRIGVTKVDPVVQGSPTTYIAGIANTGVTGGVPVYVTASGQLGFSASSERYKTAVTTLSSEAERLGRLRPVSFHLKGDPDGTLQYGLIAEEVDKVYPELVIRDRDGGIQGVRYDELAPMLLGEIQNQQSVIGLLVRQHDADTLAKEAQDQRIRSLEEAVAKVGDLERRLDELLRQRGP